MNSNIWIISVGAYMAVCALSTVYDLYERYKRDIKKLKISKRQRQMIYEEQQRKIMKEMIDENQYYEDLVMNNTYEDGMSDDLGK